MRMCLLLDFHLCYKSDPYSFNAGCNKRIAGNKKTHNGPASCLNGGLPLCVFVYSFWFLILMEHSLTSLMRVFSPSIISLNPYSNGILSDMRSLTRVTHHQCLNPYSNGTLSDSYNQKQDCCLERVLILIIMEYSLTLQNR